MKGLFKYLILATIAFCFIANASAIYTDLNAWDANGSRHANKGEDFNIAIRTASTATNIDVNSDFNYAIVLNYGPTYIDLNVQVIAGMQGAASIDSGGRIDANVETRRLTGTCTGGATRDVNVIIFTEADFNTFNVKVSIPTTSDVNALVGHEVSLELWPIADTNYNGTEVWKSTSTCTTSADANAPFVVGPAIIVKTPNVINYTAQVDQNITIIGYGFSPIWGDNNVRIDFYDANGTVLNHHSRSDLNILDTAHGAAGKYHSIGSGDTNDLVINTWSGDVKWVGGDWNGVTVYPDVNGEFDVNINVPYVTFPSIGRTDLNLLRVRAAGLIPGMDLNFSAMPDVNTSATFVITPSITIPTDVNVTITIAGVHFTIADAMSQNLITNMQAVGNLIVRMGSFISTDSSGVRLGQITVKFNSDLNMARGPIRNYGTNMNGVSGTVNINTTNMPEFGIDANVFMYKVKTQTGAMPVILKNGQPCATTTCKNLDGTALTSGYTDAAQRDLAGNYLKTWRYDATAGDGNLAFRVSTFSEYEASSLTVAMVTPNGGEVIRTPRNYADTNYTITFTFSDQNVQDNNLDRNCGGNLCGGDNTIKAIIYYSEKAADKTGVLIKDTNLFDQVGIRCNGWSDMVYSGSTVSDDVNLAQTKTCVFDVNRADVNKIIGEYVIDVNIMDPWHDTATHSPSALDASDANVFFNPPLIDLYDTNWNSANFVINNGLTSCPASGCKPDINYVVDFNIYIPDINGDQNFTLADYNIHFYLGSTQTDVLSNDLNAGNKSCDFDINMGYTGNRLWTTDDSNVNKAPVHLYSVSPIYIECGAPRAADKYFDYNCQMQFDVNGVLEGSYYLIAKIFNNRAHTVVNETQLATSIVDNMVDVNELWHIDSTDYAVSINDDNVPTASSTSGSETSASYYDMVLVCSDSTSGISKYLFKDGDGSWVDNGTTDTYRFTIGSGETLPATKSFYGGCRDYAGNISDTNATKNVVFRASSGTPTPADTTNTGPSTPTTPTDVIPGTETVLNQTISEKPTAAEIESVLRSAGASETAIENAQEAVGKTEASRTVVVEKTTAESGAVSYKSTITLMVKNKGTKRMVNVKVIEDIPKTVAANASQIESDDEYNVLKEDPIVEFMIDGIPPGSTESVSYSVNKQILSGVLNIWVSPITAEFEETAPCDGITCQTRDCQVGTCNTTTGRCEYANKADGTACGDNRECRAGTCVDKEVPPVAPVCGNAACEEGETPETCAEDCPAEQPIDFTTAAIILVAIIIILGGGAYYYYNVKGKGEAKPKKGWVDKKK